jgi:hypothetical protein
MTDAMMREAANHANDTRDTDRRQRTPPKGVVLSVSWTSETLSLVSLRVSHRINHDVGYDGIYG